MTIKLFTITYFPDDFFPKQQVVQHLDDSFIVKVRGLPYSATAHDVALFFSGCDIKGGKAEGVHFLFNPQSG